MKVEVSIAEGEALDEVWELNHQVYCRELRQHSLEPEGRKVDGRVDSAIYFVAHVGGVLAGMLSASLPGSAEFSTHARLPNNHPELYRAPESTEVRLLAVRSEYRGVGVYDELIFALMKLAAARRLDRILISAVVTQTRLYSMMGFVPIGTPVTEGGAELQPMVLDRKDFEASPYRLKRLARMERCAQ